MSYTSTKNQKSSTKSCILQGGYSSFRGMEFGGVCKNTTTKCDLDWRRLQKGNISNHIIFPTPQVLKYVLGELV